MSKKISTSFVQYIYLILFCTFSSIGHAQEICNNGIDDDGDGLIDLNDSVECVCGGIAGTASPVTTIIPNPSFEQMTSCPSWFGQFSCASGWEQPSLATTDYFNTCGFVWTPLSSSGLVPFPNGNGIAGGFFTQTYKEYIGSCLSQPMLAGQTYSLKMNIASNPVNSYGTNVVNPGSVYYGAVDITLYGTTDCNNLPFAGSSNPPAPAWQVLGFAHYTPQSIWGTITISFTPSANIASIIIGAPLTLPASYPAISSSISNYPYFYYDNLSLNAISPAPVFSISHTGTLCHNDLILNATATNSTGNWQWYKNGIALNGQINSSLHVSSNSFGAGTFTARYSEAGSCVSVSYTDSSQVPQIGIISQHNVLCFGGNDGDVTSLATGGNGILSYFWNTVPAQSGSNATHLQAGNYQVTVQDGNGCIATTIAHISQNPVIVNLNQVHICGGLIYTFNSHSYATSGIYYDTLTSLQGCDSIIVTELTVNQNYQATNYQTICEGERYSIQSHSYTVAGTYVDSLLTLSGCDSIVTTILKVNPIPVITSSHPGDFCKDASEMNLNFALPAGGIYAIDGEIANILKPQTLLPGTHQIIYTYTEPSTHCSNSVQEKILIYALPEVSFSVVPRITTLENPEIQFIDESAESANRIWNFGDGRFSELKEINQVYSDTGFHSVSLTITDNHGCKNFAADSVYFGSSYSFFIPNAFTPNGDGNNDLFEGKGMGITEYALSISDRWGNRIYKSENLNESWDGNDFPAGAYVYSIKVTDISGKEHDYNGVVSLIR